MSTQQIWVDADACPAPIKQILFRAAQRTQTPVTLVANHYMQTPASKLVTLVQVEAGFDVADNLIVQRVNAGDLVITSDIPLASEVIAKGVNVITARGGVLDKQNIRERLSMRDFMDTMRSSGVQTGGPPPLSATDKQAFANQLDSWLARRR